MSVINDLTGNGKVESKEDLIINNICGMISKHEPWDKIIEYFKSLNLSEKATEQICLNMNWSDSNYSYGYLFAMHLYGNNMPKEIR